MRAAFLTLALATACEGQEGPCSDDCVLGETDSDAAESDVEDSDAGDTDADDADETDVEPSSCEPATLTAALQLDHEPARGEDVRYTRVVDACLDDDQLVGTWTLTADDGAGDRWCGFQVSFLATGTIPPVAAGCDACDVVYDEVAWTGASFSDEALCARFGYDRGFVAGLTRRSTRLGFDLTSPDLLVEAEDGWEGIEPPQTPRRVGAVDGVTRYTSTFAITYPF